MSGDGQRPTWDFDATTQGAAGEGQIRIRVRGGAGRYVDLGVLGEGAMGVVLRVRDVELNRAVAMKTLRPERQGSPRAVARFLAEAQATAQLQHPGIVPVHDVGVLEDGRLYYTMREVRGRSLREAMGVAWREGEPGLRRVVGLVRQAADAVGYAHARGVVHRDLKPDNVLVGMHGEVLVVDWGLARVASDEEGEVEIDGAGMWATRMGTVAGTPAYMAPEQAAGRPDRVGPWTDVWALGAILYEALCARPPYLGEDGAQVIARIRSEDPPPVAMYRGGAPPGLVTLVNKALSRDPAARFQDGRAVAEALADWLEGAHRRDRARTEVARARHALDRARTACAAAREFRDRAEAMLADLPTWAPEADKDEAWTLLDRADQIEADARRAEVGAIQAVHAALAQAPDLPEAHALLADRARDEGECADRAGDAAGCDEAVARLAQHLDALPADHAARARHGAWLRGTGALTLLTDPPGAHALLHRFERRRRRLVPVAVADLGRTPLVEVPLEPGSWLVLLRAEGRAEVRYPVFVRRAEHWDGVPPGAAQPLAVPLPTPQELGDAAYVPPGWFLSGGDPGADGSLPGRRLWCDGFIADRFPVTLRRYLSFLDRLRAERGRAEAERWVPRERGVDGGPGAPLAAFDGCRYRPVRDEEGEVAPLDIPAHMIDLRSMLAYARWRARVDGAPWRLPSEAEFEKARRGVDGRIWPWGDFFDPAWACVRGSAPGVRPVPVDVARFPVDCSVYGVRGVAGNVLQATVSVYDAGPEVDGDRVVPPVVEAGWDYEPTTVVTVVGGLFHGGARHGRCASRYAIESTARMSNLSFRLVRTWPAGR